jgi:hypothetical protein
MWMLLVVALVFVVPSLASAQTCNPNHPETCSPSPSHPPQDCNPNHPETCSPSPSHPPQDCNPNHPETCSPQPSPSDCDPYQPETCPSPTTTHTGAAFFMGDTTRSVGSDLMPILWVALGVLGLGFVVRRIITTSSTSE